MSTAAKADHPMSKSNPATTWASFNWEDPFRLEQQLTDDERLVMDTARQYAQEQLAPRVQEAYREEKTDPAIFREMGELGLLGPTIDNTAGLVTNRSSPTIWILSLNRSVISFQPSQSPSAKPSSMEITGYFSTHPA